MTTQYTPILKLALPVTGELSGTWGDVVNDNITSMVEQAIAGLSNITTWTTNAHPLTVASGTTSESRCAMLIAADGSGGTALTGAGEITCPAASKLYVLKNASSYAITLKTTNVPPAPVDSGTLVPAGQTAFLFCDGTYVTACVTTVINGLISGNLTVNGNTTLGDANTDTITTTARFNTNLLPSTDNARDLGSSGNSWKDLWIDGTATMALVAIAGGTINGVSIGATTPATFLAVDNLSLDGNTLASTNTNGNVVIAPNGTGDVQLDADTVRVGDSAAPVTLTSNGAGALTVTTGGAANLVLNTNAGTNSGSITINNGANGNIAIVPDGTGDVYLDADTIRVGDSNTDVTLTTNGTGNLNLSTNSGTNSGTIQIAQGANGNITFTPNGTGIVASAGPATFTSPARTSGVASYFTVNTPTDTGQTASTESIGASFTAGTRTWATGALTTQRERVFAAPTYAFAGASTLTTAVNVDIATPIQGANASITNKWALRAGASLLTEAVTMSATTQNISLGESQTTGNFIIGGTSQSGTIDIGGTAATGAITLDASTKAHTLNVGSGATENAATKTVNIATGGVSGSTTTITIGSTNGTATTLNGTVTAATFNSTTIDTTNVEVTNLKAKDGTAVAVLTDSTGALDISTAVTMSATTQNIALGTSQTSGTFTVGGAAQTGTQTFDQSTKAHTLNIGTGATENATTKTINIGTGGVSGSTTTITIGAATGTTTTVNGTLNATTLDLTNLEVTNIKAKDGTAAIVLTDSTGAVTISTALTANGGAVFNENGANVDFRVEGDTDANLLFVDASADAVGIGTSSPGYPLEVRKDQNAGTKLGVQNQNSGAAALAGIDFQAYGGGWQIEVPASTTFVNSLNFSFNGAEKMRLASASGGVGALGIGYSTLTSVGDSGLAVAGNVGIGTSSPSEKLTVAGAVQVTGVLSSLNRPSSSVVDFQSGSTRFFSIGANSSTYGNFSFRIATTTTNTEVMAIDSSGNLGLGVTPSASNLATIQSDYGIISGNSGINIVQNAYYNSGWKYTATAVATRYAQSAGIHYWYTAPSGFGYGTAATSLTSAQNGNSYTIVSAGNTDFTLIGAANNNVGTTFTKSGGTGAGTGTVSQNISFTQAMTLDASGNLAVGTTSAINNSGYGGISLNGTSGALFSMLTNGTESSRIASIGNETSIQCKATTGFITFVQGVSGGTERARIDSSGTMLIGCTGGGASGNKLVLYGDGSDIQKIYSTQASSPIYSLVAMFSDATTPSNPTGTLRVNIVTNGGIANYQANDSNLSDRREKTNFAPAKSYLDTICAIPVQTFNYIDQSEDDPGLTLGVVAQDVQAVAPELVSESNWGTEDNPKMRLSIYQTDLQYALMKCIQELKAELDSVKAELATLKGN